MQDRYAGDVGDFSKFLLLKYLSQDSNYRIGVVWYLFPDEGHNNDGRHVAYVHDERFRECDKHLCRQLSAVLAGERSVRRLQEANLLRADTVYFSDKLDQHLRYPSRDRSSSQERLRERGEWLKRASQGVAGCNVVFLDPDNGLQVKSCSSMSRAESGKYAYYDEVKTLMGNKEVCVVYHHLGHHTSHRQQILTRIEELRRRVNPAGKIAALRFWPYSPRAYFILTSSSGHKVVEAALMDLKGSRCGKMWDYFTENGKTVTNELHVEGHCAEAASRASRARTVRLAASKAANSARLDNNARRVVIPWNAGGPCLCGCGEITRTGSFYRTGHDARARGKVERVNRGELDAAALKVGIDSGAIVKNGANYQLLTVDELRRKAGKCPA